MAATGQSDNAIEFSFDQPNHTISEEVLRTAVNDPGNKDYEAPAEADKPQAEAPALETKQVEAKPAETTVTQTPTELKTHKITVQGQEIEVTEADLLAGHMRHRDYTQKTQQLAEQAREITNRQAQWEAKEAEYQQELQAIDRFLQDKAALSAFAQKQFGVDPTAAPLAVPTLENPAAPTLADIAKIAAYNAEQVRLSMSKDYDSKLNAAVQAAREAAQGIQQERIAGQRQNLANDLDTHVNGLLKQYPDLTKFEDIVEDLMGDATKRLPTGASLADAKAQLTAAAERRMAVIQSFATVKGKEAAVQAAKLKNNSPEPPGGSPAAQTQGRKLTLNTSDQKAFREAAVADLQAYVDANS